MRSKEGEATKGFFRATARWLGALVLLPAVYQFLETRFHRGGPGVGWWLLALLLGWIGLLLPFAVLAGGVAAYTRGSLRGSAAQAVLMAVLSYLLLAYAVPLVEYRADRAYGVNLGEMYPFGLETPRGFLALRSRVESDPPARYSFSTEEPLATPPNWLTYLVHSRVALSLFAVFAALLGWVSASLTSGLSPPARANARWAMGLASGLAFFLTEAAGGEWVRAGLTHSGLLAALGPLLVPLAELILLVALARSIGINLRHRLD